MIFANTNTVKITSTISGSKDQIAIDGITASTDLTPETAQTQINKILVIVEKAVNTNGMYRTIKQEAKDE